MSSASERKSLAWVKSSLWPLRAIRGTAGELPRKAVPSEVHGTWVDFLVGTRFCYKHVTYIVAINPSSDSVLLVLLFPVSLGKLKLRGFD